MSSKISGRHTRRQKKIKGGYYGDPYMQPTCTTFQWLMGQCPPQYSGQPPCTTFQWLMGRCPPQVPQGSLLQYGGNQQMFQQQMSPPQLVNSNTGAFKFFDTTMSVYKVFEPTTSTIRDLNPQDMPVPATGYPAPRIINYNGMPHIKFYDPATRTDRLLNLMTSIIMVYNPTTGQFVTDRCPKSGNILMGNPQMGNPLMGNPPIGNPLMGNPVMGPQMGNPMTNPFSFGGKLKKHGIKGGKTKKGGKTHKNKK
jgi:hypothetical protein